MRWSRADCSAHLAIDVELCGALFELREKERQLAQRAAESKTIEESIFKASQSIIDAIQSRRAKIGKLRTESEEVEKQLRKTVEEIEEDEAIQWASKKIQFYLSEDVNTNDIMWNLRILEKEWEDARVRVEKGPEGKKVGGWWFW